MSDSDKKPKLHPANDVISKLYSTVANNKRMYDFFSAWDSYSDHILKANPEDAKLWEPLIIEHFEQVGSMIAVNKPSLAKNKQAILDRQIFPAILINTHFRLVAKNQLANALWPIELDSDVSHAILPPFNSADTISAHAHSLAPADPVLLSLELGSHGEPNTVIAVMQPMEFLTGDGKSNELLFILRVAQPRWFPKLGRMLSNTYGLTESELDVARGLHQNKALNKIAKERNRSIRTVRTQLSQVFEKTGTSSQTELISIISNLGQILEISHNGKPTYSIENNNNSAHHEYNVLTCLSNEGHQLSYAVYGDRTGQPVLSIQPTVPPEMTPRFRQAVSEAGLFFIVPYKPGSGQSSSRNYQYNPKRASQDYNAILEAEQADQVCLLGIFSGGVYALEFADSFPQKVNKIILADTGVPLRAPKDFFKMSPSVRRTFLSARLLPKVLLTPHKMVAKDFHGSTAGERRTVEYFLKDSHSDLQRVRNNEELYKITRDMISYSFEDIEQLVNDVVLWASDWRALLKSATKKHKLCFIHGEHNNVFMWKAVSAFATGRPDVSAVKMESNSQLGIFIDPKKLMHIIAKKHR